MTRRCKRLAALALFAVVVLLVLAGPVTGARAESASGQPPSSSELDINSPEELVGKKLGLVNAGALDKLLLQKLPNISEDDFMYFNSNAEIVGALMSKKIDAMICDEPIAALTTNKHQGLGIVPKPIIEDRYGYILQKNSPLTAQLNARIIAYEQDGTIDRLKQKWTSTDDAAKTMPELGWDAPNGTLRVATTTDYEPMSYSTDGRICGLTIELLELVARDLGYNVKYTDTNSASIIAEVQSGKADIGAASLSITEERKQKMDMTEPYYIGGVTAVVRTKDFDTKSGGFFEGIAKSFTSTFITEDRWLLILDGLGVTALISITSGVLGLGLGFLFVLLRRKKEGGLADRLVHILENVMGGLPVVVVLMVLYYVVFGALNIPGIIVAIIAYTIIFGAASGTIMWNAIRAIDAGQTEAGRALGFGDHDTFFLVVLPQAARQFAPLLVGQFVSLVKDTSIVGYIAVQDLTRVGDLIRARTLEAFFPLIAIAIIYFALCRLTAWLLNRFLVRRLQPKDEPRTIKGVELQ